VDEGNHVELNEKPFWFANTLTVYHMGDNYTRMELHDPAAVAPAKEKFSAIASRLAREDGGGLISIFYHPCEWVHQTFWDGVNFAHGRNPPREQWKAPPQLPAEETEAAFTRFAEYIDYIRAVPGVRFVTASDLPALYPDRVRSEGATSEELQQLAGGILKHREVGLGFQVIGGKAFSVADQFELLTLAVGQWIDGAKPATVSKTTGLFGPGSEPPPAREDSRLDWFAFRDAARDVRDFVQTQRRVPARVFIGPDPVPPADFLVALAGACVFHNEHGRLPTSEGVGLGRNTALVTARYVAQDNAKLFGDWVIHRSGFRAPKLLELARLETWSLKPALVAVH
jgi:hypothetical protein